MKGVSAWKKEKKKIKRSSVLKTFSFFFFCNGHIDYKAYS